MDETVKAAWQAYMASADRVEDAQEWGLNKHCIEEMRTDAEYERAVLEIIVECWLSVAIPNKPDPELASYEDKIEIACAALEVMQFGWYRGDLHGNVEKRVREVWS